MCVVYAFLLLFATWLARTGLAPYTPFFIHATGPILAGTLAGCVVQNSGAAVSSDSTKAAVSAVPTVGFAPGGGLPAIPASLVESIRKGEFIDLRDLLPENVFEAFVNTGDKDKDKQKRKKVPIDSFQDWALAFTAWASTIVATTPTRGLELFQYLGVIGRLARDNPPEVWVHYDKQFRQMAAAAPQAAKWNELNFQFLQWAQQKERQVAHSSSVKEICLRWNEGRYCQFSSCKKDHVCSLCGRGHRAKSCPSSRAAPYPSVRGSWPQNTGPLLPPPPTPPTSR